MQQRKTAVLKRSDKSKLKELQAYKDGSKA